MKKGYLVRETIKNGNMSEKTLYTLTNKGIEIFKELMTRFSIAKTRIFLDSNAVIINMSLIDNKFAGEYIANIKNIIQTTKIQIMEQLPKHTDIPLFGRTILERQLLFLETLKKWEENFEKELSNEREEKLT